MKTFYKVLIGLLVGICFIFAGISIGGLNQIQFNGYFGHTDFVWNAKRINDVHYQANDLIDELDINAFSGQIRFIEGDYEKVEVKANRVYDGFEVYQKQNTLIINQARYWRFLRDYESAIIEIYLPKDILLDKVKMSTGAGSLKVYNLKCQNADFNVGAGNIKLDGVNSQEMKIDVGIGSATGDNLTIHQELKANVSLGSAKLILNGHEEEYNYTMKVGLGSARVGNQIVNVIGNNKSYHGTTHKLIDVSCGLGSVKVEMEG